MLPENKALIILTPGFPVNETDTTCLPAQQLLIKAINKNFPSLKIIIISFQYPFERKIYSWNNNEVIALGINKGKLYRLWLWYNAWRKLLQIKKKNDLLGLLSFWCTDCTLVGKYFAKKFSLKHFCWILGQDAKGENRLVKLIRPRASALVAMSPFLAKEFFINHHILPAHIIPNGVEASLFKNNNKERDIDILGAGSLIPLKRYDLLIDIIKAISFHYPAIRAVVAGKGQEEKKLRLKIDQLKLQNNILFAGEKSHPEILELMQRTKILLHPSAYEGFSTVCLEALYAGAQVISFCNPLAEKINHWHIVKSKKQMLQKALDILQQKEINHDPVLVYSMQASARKMINLFY